MRRYRAIMMAAMVWAARSRTGPAPGDLRVHLPLGRTVYQTNETIEVAVRGADGHTPTGPGLRILLSGRDGSRIRAAFPADPGTGQRAEHFRIDARLLRPGRYTLRVEAGESGSETEIEVRSHLRRSEFRIVNWGCSGDDAGEAQWPMGETGLGYNTALLHYPPYSENLIRAGVDTMRCCTMSGGHQMDLRAECDWSDPYVIRGGRRRMAERALRDRTKPNCIGVHAYDEPGLTWWSDPETGEWTAHMVPSQVRSFRSAFGADPLRYNRVDPADPDHVARWTHWARWKLGFMDAAWRDARFAVDYVRPEFLTITQSQYGFGAFTDGYYVNVARSLPITSGHGGYHDWGPGYFNPAFTLEVARARDWTKPCWYMPTWYGETTADQFRLEQYLCFQTGVQGLMTPPPLDPFNPDRTPAAPGIVESNKVLARLGSIFHHMPVTRPPVAMLFSLSHMIRLQAQDPSFQYAHQDDHGAGLSYTYLAGKLLQHRFMPVLDEDIVDGTLARNHRAVILTSIDYLDEGVAAALADFAAAGGLVLRTADGEFRAPWTVDLGVVPGLAPADAMRMDAVETELAQAGVTPERKTLLEQEKRDLGALRAQLKGARILADAIRPRLEAAGIAPVFECDGDGIVATRQAAGDVEYVFAVNATHDESGDDPQLGLSATEARIRLPDDGRPLYDALIAGPAPFSTTGNTREATVRFGPGAMRVWARTKRPVAAVRITGPRAKTDTTDPEAPPTLAFNAVATDADGEIIDGALPLRVLLIDPAGNTRYDLYRATEDGVCSLRLPLAANDPAGEWELRVVELLSSRAAHRRFAFTPPLRAGVIGRRRRAVLFEQDRSRIHRFFRIHRDVTLVAGNAPFSTAGAARLAEALRPWDVNCSIVSAEEAGRPRGLTDEEAATWIGLDYQPSGGISPGTANSTATAGFAVSGPVVLLGNPDDNALVKFLADREVLPYAPLPDAMPGPGRGFLSWQFDMVGVGQESIALVAYDEDGMSEAVGSLYEIQAGLEPVTAPEPPTDMLLTPAAPEPPPPAAKVVWQVIVHDRVTALSVRGNRISAGTPDGAVTLIDADRGTVTAAERAPGPAGETAPPTEADRQRLHLDGHIVKRVAERDGASAAAYWGGRIRVVGADAGEILSDRFDHDIGALAWLGEDLVVGLSDGRVLRLTPAAPAGPASTTP